MKIAIPVSEKDLKQNICASFGRAPYFLIYDTETEANEFLTNDSAASTGGAGIKAAQSIVDSKAQALLAPRCGENAAEVLKAAGITIYQTSSTSIQINIDAFIDGKLPLLTETHTGLHKHRGN